MKLVFTILAFFTMVSCNEDNAKEIKVIDSQQVAGRPATKEEISAAKLAFREVQKILHDKNV